MVWFRKIAAAMATISMVTNGAGSVNASVNGSGILPSASLLRPLKSLPNPTLWSLVMNRAVPR